MSLRWYYRDNAGDIVELVNAVAVMHERDDPGSDGLIVHAEEGSVGRSRIRVEDPDGTFNVSGFRKVYAVEDEAIADDYEGVVAVCYTAIRTISEWSPFDGTGRVWEIDLDDLNSVLDRRVMEGADAKRPDETDVARMQWLEATNEMSLVDSDEFLSTEDPQDMDAGPLQGQRVRDIMDDCAQQSGKNWFLIQKPLGLPNPTSGYTLWYGHDSLNEYLSGVLISNHPDDTPSAAVYRPAQLETKVKIDPSRVWSGVRVNADGFSRYVTRPSTATAYALAGRDTVITAENVKKPATAIRRGNRYLRDHRTDEYIVTTTIVVSAANVNVVTWGHLVHVRLTWAADEGFDVEGGVACRVLTRTVRQIGTSLYELALELSPVGATGPAGACTGLTASDSYDTLGGSGNVPNASDGVIYYLRPGIALPREPAPGHIGSWHFPEFNGPGASDFAGDCGQNWLRAMVVGDGTLVVHTATFTGARGLTARLIHDQDGDDVTDELQTGTTGDDFTFIVSTHSGVKCTHWVDVRDDGTTCGGKWGVASPAADWTLD